MKTKYVFPAVFECEETGGYSIYFPDIPGCYTDADTIDEGIQNASDALCLMLYRMEEKGEAIPEPSALRDVDRTIKKTDFVTYVSCDTLAYRRYFNSKAVRKTLTIPSWLNDMAERENVNFSQLLQIALKQELRLEV